MFGRVGEVAWSLRFSHACNFGMARLWLYNMFLQNTIAYFYKENSLCEQ
jgi:hypothetical protein